MKADSTSIPCAIERWFLLRIIGKPLRDQSMIKTTTAGQWISRRASNRKHVETNGDVAHAPRSTLKEKLVRSRSLHMSSPDLLLHLLLVGGDPPS
jgi:hypothetical protein